MIFTVSNFISFLRVPLALLFLIDSLFWKVTAIILAMISDWLDGFLARRFNAITPLGRILDPCTDKLFIVVLLSVFLYEGHLQIWQVLAFLARDISLLIFGGYLIFKDLWKKYEIQAFWTGKIFTTIQFFILLALTLSIKVSDYVFMGLIGLGFATFIELFRGKMQRIKQS